jgi:hypothetical protein
LLTNQEDNRIDGRAVLRPLEGRRKWWGGEQLKVENRSLSLCSVEQMTRLLCRVTQRKSEMKQVKESLG